MPGSVNEPLSATCVRTRKTEPSAGARIFAVGATLFTWIVVLSLAHAPPVSQTVSVAVVVAGPSPATIVGVAPVAVAPPPRSQLNVIARPAALLAEPWSVNDAPSSTV